ncbi:AAA family ATPase [Rouxiella chamberiensis]|uniref:ATP-binding protein n=1 Tax=Rouxiella chamberiensis TaxID=1513468 RepID=A0ABY7HR33_9GAMM|nr:ATP-binding protein [Rouxiella chamberiensis]WAT01630.1 ATP-binding protein [Rouxiella chamberiensis]
MSESLTQGVTLHTPPILHLLCGKIASGKSTLAAQLGTQASTVVINEDRWLAQLYGDEMQSVADYVRCAEKLRNAMKPHLVTLLTAGVSIVLDFPANTLANREWMMSIINATGVDNRLHYLNVPDDVCKARLRARNQVGEHDFSATDAQFDLITGYFVEPQEAEGFTLVVHE